MNILLFQFLKELIAASFWNNWAIGLLVSGETIGQASIAIAIFFLVSAFFEIPTGILADKFGTKKCTLLGLLLTTIGFFINGIELPYSFRIISFLITGLGFTFMSGASTAWILHNEKISKQNFSQDNFFLSLDLIGRAATIFGAIISINLLTIGPKYMWWGLSFIGLISIIVGSKMAEFKPQLHKTSYKKIFDTLHGVYFKSPTIILILIASLFFGFEAGIRNVIHQPFVVDLNGGNIKFLQYFQIFLALIRTIGILIYKFKFSRLNKGVEFCFLALILFAGAEIVASQTKSIYLFLGTYGFAILCLGWYFPIRDSYLNHQISDSIRATMLSIDSGINKIASAISCFVLGIIIERQYVQQYWLAGGLFLCISAISILLSKKLSTTHNSKVPT